MVKETKAPLGHRFAQGDGTLVAVIWAGHDAIKVLGVFIRFMDALAYVKANYECEPLGKTKFITKNGEVLIVQQHLHLVSMEEA